MRQSARQLTDRLHALGVTERVFGLFAGRDVAGDPEDADDLAVVIPERGLRGLQQSLAAVVGKGDPFLVAQGPVGVHCRLVVLAEEIRQFAIDEVVVGLTDDLFFRRAEKPFEHLVAGQEDPFRVLQPYEVRHRFDDQALLGFACQQGHFGLLAFGEFGFAAQLRNPHLADRRRHPAEELHRPLDLFLREDGNARQGVHIGRLVEVEFLGLLPEGFLVGLREEELAGEQVADMLSGDPDGNGDIDQAVPAFVDVVVLARLQLAGEDGIAFPAAVCRFLVDPMELDADVLPAGRDQHVSVEVEDRSDGTGGFGKAFEQFPQDINVDDVDQFMPHFRTTQIGRAVYSRDYLQLRHFPSCSRDGSLRRRARLTGCGA